MQHCRQYVQFMIFTVYILSKRFYKFFICISGIQICNCVYQLHEDYKKTNSLKIRNLEFLTWSTLFNICF